jgi:hypothetical protein
MYLEVPYRPKTSKGRSMTSTQGSQNSGIGTGKRGGGRGGGRFIQTFLLLLLLFLFLLRPHIAVHDVLFVAGLCFLAKVFNRHQLYLADMLPEAKPEPISVRMARQRALDHPEIHEHISVPVSGGDVKVGVQTVFDAVYLDAVIVEHQFWAQFLKSQRPIIIVL